ncbi:anamorsin homolog [Actinia tenebrosa]|uniref:Anamorsin homolog n=1 Tax=Actinia tenebrosa TaxID=6105 RepID=A0A6P8ICY0_ACTTE|nr:anamorsin homolog [Actinia tenebrosa]
MDVELKEKQVVLVIWSGSQPPKDIEQVVSHLKKMVGDEGKVALEHADRLHMASYTASHFDVVLSGVLSETSHIHTMELLTEIARILKPNGRLILQETTGSSNGLRLPEKIMSSLKLSGFVDVSEAQRVKDTSSVVKVTCQKPNFEVGASSQLTLSFASKPAQPKADDSVAKIWALSTQDIDDEDVEILDSDTLLDEDDLKKPDPESLKSCGPTSGKKKACKNCTCGLADQESDQPAPKKTVTSSCGSCYLGDAFRCASCPYLGMPAFKPGEKIALTDRQLKGDVQ